MDKSAKNTELTFLEKIILLSLDDKGWFGNSELKIKFGLAGGILFELIQKGRIELKGNMIHLVSSKTTDDFVLDKVLGLIKASKKSRNLRNWIQRIVYKKLLLRKALLKNLIDKKVVRREEYTLLMIFYQYKYPVINTELKKKIQEDLYERITTDKKMTDHDLMLLAIMNTCKMVRKNFGGFIQYLKLRSRIHLITQFPADGTESEKLIKLLQTAIARAIMASNVSIHT